MNVNYPCPKCNEIIPKNKGAYEAHMEVCKNRYVRPKIICLRAPREDSEFFTFYDKGHIHCLTRFGLQKYLSIGQTALQNRLAANWTMKQLLGKETTKKVKAIKKEKKTLGTKEKQQLLMRAFSAKK